MLSDKAPYFITVVVAGLAWTITHIADRMLNTPLLTYDMKFSEVEAPKTINLTIKNVTRNKTFKSVRLILTAGMGDVLGNASVVPVQPAWEGDQPGRVAGRTFEFTFAEMQPGSQFLVAANYNGPGRPSIRMSAQNDVIYFSPPSWSTFVIEHEIVLLFVLFAVGALLLLYSLWATRRMT